MRILHLSRSLSLSRSLLRPLPSSVSASRSLALLLALDLRERERARGKREGGRGSKVYANSGAAWCVVSSRTLTAGGRRRWEKLRHSSEATDTAAGGQRPDPRRRRPARASRRVLPMARGWRAADGLAVAGGRRGAEPRACADRALLADVGRDISERARAPLAYDGKRARRRRRWLPQPRRGLALFTQHRIWRRDGHVSEAARLYTKDARTTWVTQARARM